MADLKCFFSKKPLEIGHIVAVRYVWNSYIGVIRLMGLSTQELNQRHWAVSKFHSLKDTSTFQIIGHVDEFHSDYNKEVFDWCNKDGVPDNEPCPIPIKIYSEETYLNQPSHAL